MKFSKRQEEAINHRGSNAIISAGAGSGKTMVLTERITRLLDDDTKINNLLVLTFTKNAAHEMKERVRRRLVELKDYENLELLDTAYITTFDSFSLSILERYHYLLGLRPNIKVLSEEALSFLRLRFIDQVFEYFYMIEDKVFLELIKDNVVDNDKYFKNNILLIKSKIDKLDNRKRYLNNYFDIVNEEENLKRFERFIFRKKDELKDLFNEVDGNEKFLKSINDFFNDFYEINSLDELIKYANNFNKYPSRSGKNDEFQEKEVWDNFKSEFDKLLLILNKYNSTQDIKEEAINTNKYIKKIIEIIERVNELEDEFMMRSNYLSFEKIATLGIKLLEDNEDVRKELRDEFREIMIDEYQDTSDIQDRFVYLLSNNNIYMVGDIKQSIYRFRNANPDIFKEKYINYSINKGGIKIDLLDNFRSRKEVIDPINKIFQNIMTDSFGGANYKESHIQRFGNKKYLNFKKENNKMKAYVYESDEKLEEIFFIAKDINEKIKNHYQIYDKDLDKLRDVEYKDFAILVKDRSMNEDYINVLEYFNIPSNVSDDKVINKNNLFLLIRSLFKALVEYPKLNKKSKYYFVSLLRSFLYQEDDDNIIKVVKEGSIEDYKFNDTLKKISFIKNDLNVNELYKLILKEFKVYEKLDLVDEVNESLEILDKMNSLSEEFSDLNLDLSDFIELLDRIIDEDITIKMTTYNDSKNSVNISNVHKAKGLEYKITYFPNLSKRANMQDVNSKFDFDKELGIIIPYIKDKVSYNSFKNDILKDKQKEEELSETLRLLYVALTRVREEIILFLNKNNRPDTSFANILYDLVDDYKIEMPLSKITNDYLIKKNKKIDINNEDKFEIRNLDLLEEVIKDTHYSKDTKEILNSDIKNLMNIGTYVHSIFEYLDFKNPDYSLVDKEYLEYIKALLESDIDFKSANIYKEHEFCLKEDNELKHGIIDLILEYEDEIKIIDYKLKNIDDPSYKKQLSGYKKYIESISDKKVSTYLYSIIGKELKEI